MMRIPSRFALIPLLMAACAAPAAHPELPVAAAPARLVPPTIRVQVRDGKSLIVLAVPTEAYVAATILSEVDPPEADERILERMYEVQAVISRTYAVTHRGRHAREGFDVCATTHCQLYEPGRLRSSKWTALVRQATERTGGQVLLYAGAPARTVYHADCGGHTSSAQDVWGGEALPYLAGVRDSGSAIKHADWTFESKMAALRTALNTDPRTAVGQRLDGIDVAQRDSAGRAEEITIRGSRPVTVRGEIFREVVSRAFGVKSLRSTLFSLSRSGDAVVFTGRGFGHGVGLCQAGAFARLQSGASPAKVLAYYFPGTKLWGAK